MVNTGPARSPGVSMVEVEEKRLVEAVGKVAPNPLIFCGCFKAEWENCNW